MRRLTSLVTLALLANPAWAGELRVGAAAVPITPPAGTPMAGYYSERGAQGVHDDLYARSIVIEAGGRAAALVVLDLITTPRELVEQARAEIERTSHVRGVDVMISATHTHTGPVVDRNSPFGGKSDRVRDYLSSLPAKIAESVRRAESQLAPARVLVACGREKSIAFNRRYHMKDGTVGWNPGKLNPGILKPAGPIDPEVPVVYFESTSGKPLATYVNYAVHLDNVGEPKISADLPFTLARALSDFKGSEMITVYSTGCCGDVNHIDVRWSEPQRGSSNAARMGTILAAEVLRTWPSLKPVGADALRVRSTIVPLLLPTIGEADVARSRAVVARLEDPGGDGRASSRWLTPSRRGTSPRATAGRWRSRCRSSRWVASWRGSRCPARSSPSWAWRSSKIPHSDARSSPSWPMARSDTSRLVGPMPRGTTRSSVPDAPRARASDWLTLPTGYSRSCMPNRKTPSPPGHRRQAGVEGLHKTNAPAEAD